MAELIFSKYLMDDLMMQFMKTKNGYFKTHGIRVAYFQCDGKYCEPTIEFIFPHRILSIELNEFIDNKEKSFEKLFKHIASLFFALREEGMLFTSDL